MKIWKHLLKCSISDKRNECIDTESVTKEDKQNRIAYDKGFEHLSKAIKPFFEGDQPSLFTFPFIPLAWLKRQVTLASLSCLGQLISS